MGVGADGCDDAVCGAQAELSESQALADEYARALGQARTEAGALRKDAAEAKREASEARQKMEGELPPPPHPPPSSHSALHAPCR